MFNYLIVFFAIYVLGSPQGLAVWWVHLLAAIFALVNLHKVSYYYLFWIYLLIALLCASEPRFSLEYFLLAAGFIAWSLSNWWQNLSQEKRKNFLLIVFILLYIAEKLHCTFYERGSLLLWLPVFLSLYYPYVIARRAKPDVAISLSNTRSDLVYLISGLALLFSNKKTAILAFLASLANYLRSRYVYLAGLIVVGISFFFLERIQHFIHKSLISRLFIWCSTFQGWLAKPLLGHGFGTFAIDFPPYRSHNGVFGAQTHQQVSHGHGLFTHVLFEQGLLGLIIVLVIFYLVYKNARPAFLPLLIISLFDAPLVCFNQYLLAALILVTFLNIKLPQMLLPGIKVSKYLAYIIALVIFIPSIVGHYYYDQGSIDKAIQWDSRNSLYHFMRGADLLNLDTQESEKSLEKAIELSPNVSYFYGFLAAAKLANLKFSEAQAAIAKALYMDGDDQYWYVLSAFSHYNDDKDIFKQHYAKALELNPDIDTLLRDPSYTATEFIGAKKADARVVSFYRKGHKVFLPLPYIETPASS